MPHPLPTQICRWPTPLYRINSSLSINGIICALSEILKQRRKELKMTQEELAAKLGKKRPYISRVENGEDVRISNFVQIARVLGLGFDLRPI